MSLGGVKGLWVVRYEDTDGQLGPAFLDKETAALWCTHRAAYTGNARASYTIGKEYLLIPRLQRLAGVSLDLYAPESDGWTLEDGIATHESITHQTRNEYGDIHP